MHNRSRVQRRCLSREGKKERPQRAWIERHTEQNCKGNLGPYLNRDSKKKLIQTVDTKTEKETCQNEEKLQ